jgi:NRAMP (natural resistance-associated macrophage protein)-like metal ion transporter
MSASESSDTQIAGNSTPAPASPKNFWQRLGPGLITGASDDDPSGIATYSQAGAQFQFLLLWTMLLTLPLMVAIQEISARIGRVSGQGIAANIRRQYSPWILYPLIAMVIAANTVNLGADIGAMGAALKLVIGGPALLYAVLFAIVCASTQVLMSYRRFANALKWLSLVLLSYVATALMIHVPWRQALHATLVPSIQWNRAFLTTLIAVMGTTISPYLFFWQSSLETEEMRAGPIEEPLKIDPTQTRAEFNRISWDTWIGMAASNLIAFFVMLTAGAVLYGRYSDIQTSQQAAAALKPLAGRFAESLFAAGIIGTGLMAVPVLAGSAGYAAGEAMNWRTGLDRKPNRAKAFYAVIVVATLLGLAVNFTPLDPFKALFWSAVLNGIASVPVMVIVMIMASSRGVMGSAARIPMLLRVVGWIATAAMAAACIGLFVTWQ